MAQFEQTVHLTEDTLTYEVNLAGVNNHIDAEQNDNDLTSLAFKLQHQPDMSAQELAELEATVVSSLQRSTKRPTDIFITPWVTNHLADSGLRAAYLERMLGGQLLGDENRHMRRADYWQPISQNEWDWLIAQRRQLSGYFVAAVIDETLADILDVYREMATSEDDWRTERQFWFDIFSLAALVEKTRVARALTPEMFTENYIIGECPTLPSVENFQHPPASTSIKMPLRKLFTSAKQRISAIA